MATDLATARTALDALVQAHYPHAVPASIFREQAFGRLERELGISLSNVLLATSICADDIVFITDDDGNIETHHITRELLGPFEMGGLAGLPFTGLTGMTAYAHHIPDHGAACIVYGPHIGISEDGELGKVLRPGQHGASTACGALGVALKHFQSSPDYEPLLDEDDSQEALLELRLQRYRAQILAAPHPLQAATNLVYDIIHQLVHRYVRTVKDQFRCEYIALIGVLIVNTSPQYEDYIDLRHWSITRIADL
jgi:hypothetical protein